MHTEDPGHTGIGVEIPAVKKFLLLMVNIVWNACSGVLDHSKIFLPQYMRM